MPAELVPLTDLQNFLNVHAEGEVDVLKAIRDAVRLAFERQCDRERVPFQDAQTGRVEVHAGTGSALLTLDYPIAALTSVKLGHDSANPIETLSVADVNSVVFGVGDRAIERVDGGLFGEYGTPRYVHVTYNAAADLPADVATLVMRVIAQIYRQRGSEDAKAESVDGYSRTMADLTVDPMWLDAVKRHGRGVFL